MFTGCETKFIGNVRVISTDSLAQLCGTDTLTIINNFVDNREHFLEGVHYHFNEWSQLWTERGAALHASMIDTVQASTICAKMDAAGPGTVAPPQRQDGDDKELESLAWLWRSAVDMHQYCTAILPLLKVAEHKHAPHFAAMVSEYDQIIKEARHILRGRTAHIECNPLAGSNWSKLLPLLRRDG